MANLTGGIYITFQKPYLNMVSEIIENNEQIKVGGRLQIIEQTDVVKSFLKSVKNKNERDIEKVLKVGSQYAGIFNTHKWTEIDKSQFTNLGGASDGKTTQQQELASLFAIQKSIENNGYTNQKKFYELYREDLIKIYPDMNEEWENTFFQQQLTTYREVGNTPYKHYSRDGGFMDYITGICKNKYGIAKKDTWNPADIWLVYDFPKVKRALEKYVMDDVTPIEEFNAILRDMFHARKIIGISLKKMSGRTAKWELVNLENMDVFDNDEYQFKLKSAQLSFNMAGKDKFKNSDAKIVVSGKQGDVKFQIRQNSAGFNNLKIEGTDMGATSARLGKVPLSMAATLFKKFGIPLNNDNKKFPRTASEFEKRASEFLYQFKKVESITSIKAKDFQTNVMAVYGSARPDFAHSKLMQLDLLCKIYSLKEKDRNDLLTSLTYLAQKKGNIFGPFGKLY